MALARQVMLPLACTLAVPCVAMTCVSSMKMSPALLIEKLPFWEKELDAAKSLRCRL